MNTKTEQNSSVMEAVVATDHPDLVGGIVWSRIELEWINKRLSDAEAIINDLQNLVTAENQRKQQFEAEVAAKDAEILEQCRINGIGAEREAALLGKVAQQSAALKLARQVLMSVKETSSSTRLRRIVDEPLAAIDSLQKGE